MFLKKLIILACLAVIITGCATTHPGTMSSSSQPDDELKVSVKQNNSLTDQYYYFLEYTFENTSPEWVNVQVQSIGFPKTENELLVSGKLTSWLEGAELKLKKNQYNTNLILGGIAAVGAVAGATSSNNSVRVAGFGALGMSYVAATAVSINRAQEDVNSEVDNYDGRIYVPNTHILAPFKVAPGSYLRRWVVIRKAHGGAPGWSVSEPLFTDLKKNKKEVTYKTEI